MTTLERSKRLVGDMPWVTEHLTQEQIDDLAKQICASMDAAIDEGEVQYIPDGHYVVEDGDGVRFVKKDQA